MRPLGTETLRLYATLHRHFYPLTQIHSLEERPTDPHKETAMQVQPYIFFEGRCEEALTFYKKALKAEVTAMMRYSEMPPTPDSADATGCASGMTPPPDSIMHASFKVGDTEVMASDGMSSGKPEFKGVSLSLSPATKAEAKKIFAALSDGGQVQMPIAKTFFSPCFGMVADKFGVSWMVVVPDEMPAQ